MGGLKYQQAQIGFNFYFLCAHYYKYLEHNLPEKVIHFLLICWRALIASHVNVDDSVFQAKVIIIVIL